MLINKNKGMTLVEVLVTIGVLILVIFLCVLMLYGARKEARDVKRVSDIGVLRSSMAAIKVQFGSYLEAGCQPGAVFACQGGNLAQVMNTVFNFKDPRGTVLCADDCSKSCQYSFSQGMTAENFEVLFYLEKGVGNFDEKGCYQLTEQGIRRK